MSAVVEFTKLVISATLRTQKSTTGRDTRKANHTAILPMTPVCDNMNTLLSKARRRLTWCGFSEDERSIANKLAREEKVCFSGCQVCTKCKLTIRKRQNEPEPMGKEEAESKKDPTLPVNNTLHS